MQPADNGKMNTTIVALRSAEFDQKFKGLTPLGDLQVRLFSEAMAVKGITFTTLLCARGESDSWTTSHDVGQSMHCGDHVKALKSLPISDRSEPHIAEVRELIATNSGQPLTRIIDTSEYRSLLHHSQAAVKEIRGHIATGLYQQVLICSRYSEVLASLLYEWMNELIFAGFKLCPHDGLPGFPVNRDDMRYGAVEFELKPGQAFMFRFDASDSAHRMVSSIQYVDPEALIRH